MATRCSNENVAVEYFRESQATAMAVDITGEFALLAGRRGLDVINLDNRGIRYPRVKRKGMMKWDISVVEWNPHLGRHKEFVTASNQVADLYVQHESDWFQQHSLKAHSRAISDLNWSVFEPDLLATCSVDMYIYVWDTREPRKPSLAFSTFAGAAQVKWNKKNSHYLATVHEGDIRLWDKRKSNQAVQYISASLAKIHGLDWDPGSEFFLVTASQDCTAKFWDVRDPKSAILELRANSPLWRAKYTPFGDGVITATVPQLRRGDKTLLLWSQSNPSSPIHSFTGHTDDVLDFHWRPQKEGSTDYQLVTWSRDHSLRIWCVETHLQKLCGEDIPEILTPPDPLISSFELVGTPKDINQPDIVTPSVDTPSSLQGANRKDPLDVNGTMGNSVGPESIGSSGLVNSGSFGHKPSVLEQEFGSFNVSYSNITVKMDVEGRSCIVTALSNRHIILMKIMFPTMYPEKAPPQLVFLPPTTLDGTVKHKLLKILEDTCMRHTENKQRCLEPCLQQLSVSLDTMQLGTEIPVEPPKTPTASSYKQTSSSTLSMYDSPTDSNIPFPRTSGARFCGVDKLVVFLRPSTVKKTSSHQTTPRALSSLSAMNLLKPVSVGQGTSNQSLLRTFYKEREKRRFGKHRKKTSSSDAALSSKSSSSSTAVASSLVVLYSAVGLTPVHQELAEQYQFISNNIPLMCTLNAKAAAAVGRTDLVQVWSLAALSNASELRPDPDPDGEMPWALHPFGRQMLQTLLDHYSSVHDVQTLAMLTCAFGSLSVRPGVPSASMDVVKSYLVTDRTDPIFTKEWLSEKTSQPLSFSESPDDYRFRENRDPESLEKERHQLSTRLLEPSLTAQFDAFKKSYADILSRWKLLKQRAQVLNYVTSPSLINMDLCFSDFVVVCQKCHKRSYNVQCEHCKKYSFHCAICHTPVKGLSSFCLACGHGGHTTHMLEWFKTEDVCPTGCGCHCLTDTMLVCEDTPLATDPIVSR